MSASENLNDFGIFFGKYGNQTVMPSALSYSMGFLLKYEYDISSPMPVVGIQILA